MKIFVNIVLAAVAIVLAVNILSTIDRSKIDTIKNNFTTELPEYKSYTLVPKQWGLDTIKVINVGTFLTLELEENLYQNRKIYVFLSPNNNLLKAVSSDLYELQK